VGASPVDRRRGVAWGKAAGKVAIAAVVAVALRRYVLSTWDDFRKHGQSLQVDAGWVAASCGVYLVGLSCFGLYFGRVLEARPLPALRAYLMSHLGKYVPGKAMVVVLRAGLMAPTGTRPATSAFATLYETLVMMAAGGFVAAIGFATAPGPLQAIPALAGLGLGVGFLVLVEPRVFPRLSGLIRVPFPSVGPDALPALSHRKLAEGLIWASVGWTLLGLSQVAAVRALFPDGVEPRSWPLVGAGVALATVSGFVSGLPGGAFVREWVLLKTLSPAVGEDRAVVSAIALRLTWVLGEASAAAALALVRPGSRSRSRSRGDA